MAYKYIPSFKVQLSPNHFDGRHNWKADIVVLHQTGGSTLQPALNWFNTPGAISAHFLLDVDGGVVQCCDLNNGSYCNGTGVSATDPKTKDLYYGYATSRLVRERKTNANYYTYSIEIVHCAKGDINVKQINACIELIREVIIPHMKSQGVTPVIDREHIIGHCDVTPKTRAFCPGVNFPWDKVIEGVKTGKYYNDDSTTTTTSTTTSSSATIKKTDKCNIIVKSNGVAAIRTAPSKYGNTATGSRCIKGNYYAIDAKVTTTDGWLWLKHANILQYSAYKDLDTQPNQQLFSSVGTYTKYKTTAKLNVRSTPKYLKDNSNKINDFAKGAYIFVLDVAPVPADGYNWVTVLAGGKLGYVAKEWLTKI